MRILRLTDQLTKNGGSNIHIHRLTNEHLSLGHYSEVVSIQQKSGRYTIDFIEGSSIVNVNYHQLWNSLTNYLKKSQFDLVHIHDLDFPKLISDLSSVLPLYRTMHEQMIICPGHIKYWTSDEKPCVQPYGLHCIAHAYSKICAPRNPINLYRRWINTGFEISNHARCYKKIVVCSDYMKSEAVLAGIKPEKLTKIFAPIPLPTKVKRPQERKKILFAGRVARAKGVHLMLEAMRAVLTKHHSWQLDVLGDGYEKAELEKMSNDLGIAHNVHFHGWKEREVMEKFYMNHDFMIFPSIFPEPFGMAGAEALAYGLPVIGFDIGGVNEWLINGETGILVESKDIRALSEGILEMIENKELRDDLGRNGRELVKERFSSKVVASHMIRMYQEDISTF